MSRYITVEAAAAHLNISRSYLNQMRLKGNGPTFLKFGHTIRYTIDDLDKWAEARRYTSTTQVDQNSAA